MNGCPREQKIQKPKYSPGIINNNELIGYVILDPDHLQNGKLTNAAFSHSKLKKGNLSVSRIQYTSIDEIQQNIIEPQIQRKPERRFVGILVTKCAKIRSIKANHPVNSRAICVIDDGTVNDIAHSVLSYSIHITEPDYWKRNDRWAVRANLIETFEEKGILKLEEAFSD